MSIVNNRKAYFEYHILEEFEAGIVLLGSEVKSIRMGNVTLTDSFIYLKSGEVWIKNFKVARYKQTHLSEKHEDNREKKLLLTKIQIVKISRMMEDKGITCVPPLKLFNRPICGLDITTSLSNVFGFTLTISNGLVHLI